MGGSGWTPKEGFIAELNVIPGEIIQQMLLEAGQEPRCCGGSSLLPKIQPQSRDGVMGTIPIPAAPPPPAQKQPFAISFRLQPSCLQVSAWLQIPVLFKFHQLFNSCCWEGDGKVAGSEQHPPGLLGGISDSPGIPLILLTCAFGSCGISELPQNHLQVHFQRQFAVGMI